MKSTIKPILITIFFVCTLLSCFPCNCPDIKYTHEGFKYISIEKLKHPSADDSATAAKQVAFVAHLDNQPWEASRMSHRIPFQAAGLAQCECYQKIRLDQNLLSIDIIALKELHGKFKAGENISHLMVGELGYPSPYLKYSVDSLVSLINESIYSTSSRVFQDAVFYAMGFEAETDLQFELVVQLSDSSTLRAKTPVFYAQ